MGKRSRSTCEVCGVACYATEEDSSLHSVLDALPLSLCIVDCEGAFQFVNRAFEEMFEGPAADIIGKTIFDFHRRSPGEEDLTQYFQRRVTERPPATPLLSEVETLRGRAVEVVVDWSYWDDADGTLQGFVAVVSDRAARQHATSVLQRIGLLLMDAGVCTGLQFNMQDKPSRRFGELTRREQEVVDLLAQGSRVPTIARKLYISPNTVRNHLKRVYQKLGVHSQEELIELLTGVK